jgi:type III secretion protein W
MSFSPSPIQPVNDVVSSQQAQTARGAAQSAVVQEEMQQSLQSFMDQTAVNFMQIIRQSGRTLDDRNANAKRMSRSDTTDQKAEEELDVVQIEIEEIQEVANYLENKGEAIQQRSLKALKDQITKFDTEEEIIQKVLENFSDPINAEAAIEYLLRVVPDELKQKVYNAQQIFRKRFEKKLKAAKNIMQESLEFEKEGLGDAKELRDFYSDLTSDSKPALEMFEELLKKFTYDKMKLAINFWLHALGADLNKKGSSIQKGELHKMIQEAKSFQAILGVYRFFAAKQRELIITLARLNQNATEEMNYQNLAKLFVRFLQEKYPSPEKVLFYKHDLKIESQLRAQEAVFNIMCSAIKNVSPKLYRNQKHQEEVLSCFLTALEAIDEVLEEEEES